MRPILSMRWSIRNQILIPLIAIQAVAMAATTITTATLAARRSQRQIVDRLNGVIDALGHANFPYTGSVLARMRGLSGAHFVAYAEDGRVTGSSLPNIEGLPPALRSLPAAGHLDSLGEFPTATLEGKRYVGVSLRLSGGPRGTSLLMLYPEAGWRQARWEATMPPLILGAGSLGVMVLVTSWIAHRIGLRLRRVQRQVARIVDGEFQELPLGGHRDEVEDLSRSINHMCVQLREMRRTIGETERSRLLAQFAAGLAHQLRNSLTGARLSVQLHAKRYPAHGDDQTLGVALRQLAMTEEQVKGLLSLGRVEGRPPVACDLRQLLTEVAFLVHPACQHAGVALEQPGADRPLAVLADPSGVRAALLNLTLNAIEAAGAGGSVRLEAIHDGDEAAVEVADTGPGPPPELADSLCEAFVTSKPEGVGLGLALAHRVASDHGGRLGWVRTEGETRFRLTLPLIDATTKGGS
jgi:signal transduction histidine kinase